MPQYDPTREAKLCPRCGESKPSTHFHKNGTDSYCKPCRSAVSREWYARNREKALQQHREWKHENAAHYKAQQREYCSRDEVRERLALQVREWRAANPERALENSRRAEKKRDPLKRREKCSRYRARKTGASRVEVIDRAYVYERDGGICHICRRQCARKKFTLDHLVPLFHGGDHTHDNLRVAHFSCNSRRGPGRLPAQLLLVA